MTNETDGKNTQLNVGALIELLKTFPPSLPVVTEGCDCHGEACDVVLMKDGKAVLITRCGLYE